VLSQAGAYPTGGLGGILAGSAVDHPAAQGSLSYDPWHSLLYVVGAGSDSVSVFAVNGDRLALRQVLGSGGSFPVSVATRGDLVYVLNALGVGRLQGVRVLDGVLVPISGSGRALGLDPRRARNGSAVCRCRSGSRPQRYPAGPRAPRRAGPALRPREA
jgi:hypothetical protein